MSRCKALVRGGSRRCKRKALKGQMYCSQCGGRHLTPHNNNNKGISSQMTAIAHNGRRPSSPRGFIGPRNQPHPSSLTDYRFNMSGLGIAYRNHFVRTFKEAGRTLLGVGVIETTSRASHHPTIARNVGYRYAFRPFLTITGGIATKNMIFDYGGDLAEGNFPGTDESIFVH